MPSQMKGSSVPYSSFAELKKAHTCRCWRSIERANGIGDGAEPMQARFRTLTRRQGPWLRAVACLSRKKRSYERRRLRNNPQLTWFSTARDEASDRPRAVTPGGRAVFASFIFAAEGGKGVFCSDAATISLKRSRRFSRVRPVALPAPRPALN